MRRGRTVRLCPHGRWALTGDSDAQQRWVSMCSRYERSATRAASRAEDNVNARAARCSAALWRAPSYDAFAPYSSAIVAETSRDKRTFSSQTLAMASTVRNPELQGLLRPTTTARYRSRVRHRPSGRLVRQRRLSAKRLCLRRLIPAHFEANRRLAFTALPENVDHLVECGNRTIPSAATGALEQVGNLNSSKEVVNAARSPRQRRLGVSGGGHKGLERSPRVRSASFRGSSSASVTVAE